jgi:GH25 family lysozyme M1 (1,4-beta-N-acetylmuramidase)
VLTAGIDVFQKYQGSVNWSQVRAAGLSAVFVKLSNGANVASPAGDSYVSGARAAGLKIGGYAYVLGGSATAQADAFAAQLTRLNAMDLAPAIDFEDASLPTSAASRRSFIASFFARLKARIPSLGRVLLYGSGALLVAINAGTITVPGLQVLIWDAEYGPNDGAEHPRTHYTAAVAVHQYTSVGRVAGISGNVDRDTVYTDISAVEDDLASVNQNDWDALIWRVGALTTGLAAVQSGPTKGERVALGVRIPSIGAKIDALTVQLNAIQGTLPPNQADVLAAIPTDPSDEVDVDDLASKLSAALGPDVAKALGAKLAS